MFFSMNTKKKILLFIAGPVPTVADRKLADSLADTKTIVNFRNAEHVSPDDSLEKCDSVCGAVPARYLTPKNKDEKLPPVIDGPTLPGLGIADAPVAVPSAAPAAAPAPVASTEPEPALSPAPAPAPAAPVKPAKRGKK